MSYPGHLGCITALLGCYRCIKQHQPTGLSYPELFLEESLLSAEMHSLYFTALADWAVISRTLAGGVLPLCRDAITVLYRTSKLGCHIQDARWGEASYLSAEIQSLYSTALANWGFIYRTLAEGVLPLRRDAVNVLYSPSQLGCHNQDTRWGVLPLCRDAVTVL